MLPNRSRFWLWVALLPCALVFAGCSDDDEPATSNLEGKAKIEIDGVTVLFPSTFGANSLRGENEVRTLAWPDHTVELDDGKLSYDGEIYGIVEDGNTVIIEEDGTVLIDGRVSTPVQPSNITFNGVKFALEGQHGDVTHENNAHRFIDMKGRLCRLQDGEFTIDGASYGTLSEGDEVTVSLDGSIRVNGEPRDSQ